MIKLIASDMDGTLLSSHLSISEFNKEVVKKAQNKGIEFMVATGRSHSEARPVLNEAGIHCGMITGNGAQVFDADDNVVHTAAIDKHTVQEVMTILEENNLYFELMTSQGVFSNSQPQRIENFATMLAENIPHLTFKMAIAMASTHIDMLPVEYVKDYQELMADDDIEMLKVITFSDQGLSLLNPVAEKLAKLDDLYITSSFPNNLEINHVEAKKGNAVARIAEEKGIDLSDVLAIGDNYNDVSMLEIAGVSFAMGNAEPGVKEIAKYETVTNVENGVGKAILRAVEENL